MRIWPLLTIACLAATAQAQAQAQAADDPTAGRGFLAEHGERAAVMGYPETGLEVWAYPLQILSGWRVSFREAGQARALDGAALLTRIERDGAEVVRVYSGPDFVVRERVFTPLDQPGAILAYEVEGRPEVEIEVRFSPSLDLMSPAALAGQSIAWDPARSGYVEREPLHGLSAVIRSPDAVAHDALVNRTKALNEDVVLVLKPHATPGGGRIATVYIASDPPHAEGAASQAQALQDREGELRREAQVHAGALEKDALQITTPDPVVNRALSGAVEALDQAWVCDPPLGCGEVAGYGPSRRGRRPQYDWFFAGDGLVAVDGLAALGEYERARQELEFIARYQNKSDGMIWHEIPQSAAYLDWSKSPYLFVHVDITFQYLASVAGYVTASGDQDFLQKNWAGLEAAYRYCRSLINSQTHLPQIPAGKEGQNEQDKMRDDLRLSSAWIDAADGFARLARMAGRAREAADAEQAADAARKAIAAQDWDAGHGFWLSGHTLDGRPIFDQRSRAVAVLGQGVFQPVQVDAVLDRLAGPDFQTDWGQRSVPSSVPEYDPNAYARGSVSALASGLAATAFWDAHRPLTGWSLWRSLADWSALDSPGRMHEVLAGDLFHPEMESVPEQTWSSAAFVTSAVKGLFGLEIDGARRLTLAPHLPAEWAKVELRNLRVGATRLDVRITRDASAMSLEVENPGEPVAVDFDPEIPLGADLAGAQVNGAEAKAMFEPHAQDEHARIRLVAGHGVTTAVIRYDGGVRISTPEPALRIGDESHALKIRRVSWADGALTVNADVRDESHASLELRTSVKPVSADGARLTPLGDDAWRLQFSTGAGQTAYAPATAVVRFEKTRSGPG